MNLLKTTTFVFFLCINFCLGQNAIIGSIENSVTRIDENKLFSMLETATEYHGTTPIEIRVILTEGDSEKIRGIENRYVTTADLNIQAYDLLTGQHLDSKDIKLTGTGSTETTSCNDVVRSIRSKKSKITSWLSGLDSGEIDCALVQQKIRSLINANDHSGAFMLANNPKCTDGSFELKEEIMRAYQDQSCSNNLRKTEALIAIKNYEEAVDQILRIDPDSNCGENINELIEVIEENYEADTNQAYDFYLKYLESEGKSREQRAMLMEIILLNKLLDE